MTCLVNYDGTILPESEARVPVLDRGFLFGDSIYEVLRTRRGRFIGLEDHLARLHRSADRLRLVVPLSDDELVARCRDTVAAAANDESYVRVILTRGTGAAPNIDLRYAPEVPTLLILVRPLPTPPADLLTRGLSAWLVTTRRNDRRALDPAIKSGNYLNNIMGLMEAQDRGADTALFLNTQGNLTEAPTANAWIVSGGRILTPPLEAGILEGVTRGLLLEMGRELRLPMEERDLDEAALRSAEEVFLSSTISDISPVTRLDGRPIGDGRPGPVALDLAARFPDWLDARGG
ncbi:MAG: aminotransferase class IV [Planctomycetota bacterium]